MATIKDYKPGDENDPKKTDKISRSVRFVRGLTEFIKRNKEELLQENNPNNPPDKNVWKQ